MKADYASGEVVDIDLGNPPNEVKGHFSKTLPATIPASGFRPTKTAMKLRWKI